MTSLFVRLCEKLNDDLGEDILAALYNPNVTEIMRNSDESIWVDKKTQGQMVVGKITDQRAYSIIYAIAGLQGKTITALSPHLETTLPYYLDLKGERFTAQIPPLVPAPTFSIRKRTEQSLTLDDYVATLRMTEPQKICLQQLIQNRQNILLKCGNLETRE